MLFALLLATGCFESVEPPVTPHDSDAPEEGPPTVHPDLIPEVTQFRLPAGEVIVRDSCFESSRPPKPKNGGPATTAAPKPSPSSPTGARPGHGGESGIAGSGDGGAKQPTVRSEPARLKPAVVPSPPPPRSAASEAEATAPREESPDPDRSNADLAKSSSDYASTAKRLEPSVDWGATVYLSNDDSMSLASAQRLLFALDAQRPFREDEIRPHELLNYFSFDTKTPQDQLFAIQGSAVREGDTLSVALAVRGAVPPRQPLDLTILVDRSGSMRAEGRMEYIQRGLRLMSDQLKKGDRLDLVLFDNRVCTPLENFVVGRDDPALLTGAIAQMKPRGSTNLQSGLNEAYRIQTSRDAADVHGRNRRVMVVTDAFLNTGDVNEDVVSQVGAGLNDHGIRLTGVGVGREFNDTMLDKLTEKGKGAYVYLGSEAVVDRVFSIGFDSLTQTIAHDVQFALDLPPSLAMEKFYGEEASTNPEDVLPINYYAGTSQLFLQDLKARNTSPKDPLVMTISYRSARTGEPETQVWQTTLGSLLDSDVHNVRKAQALMTWTDLLIEKALAEDACGASLQAWQTAAARVDDDAEIAYVDSLTAALCDYTPDDGTRVKYKVQVESDVPVTSVGLRCGATKLDERLSGSDTVATFLAPVGDCTLQFQGKMPMKTDVQVPTTGAQVRCRIRGGRVRCH